MADTSDRPGAASPPKSPSKSPRSAGSPLSAVPDDGVAVDDVLAVDENPDDADRDSTYDTDDLSDATSLRSSILRYRTENGRTYHAYKDGSYVLPNDEEENERLDLQHNMFILTFEGLHAATFDRPPQRVLDVGCGTGIWSIEFADAHPEAHVTGIDLSPIQPSFVPPNVSFFVDDIEDDWNFSTPFDYVFARFCTGSIMNWPRFFKQSFDNMTSGGTIELQDIIYPMCSDDGTLTEDCALKQWSDQLHAAFKSIGRGMDSANSYPQQLAEAGFVDIQVVHEKWPTNKWPRDAKYKQIGIWNTVNILNALGALSLALFTRPKEEGGLGWSVTELEVLLAGVRKDLRDTKIHAYWQIPAVIARKP